MTQLDDAMHTFYHVKHEQAIWKRQAYLHKYKGSFPSHFYLCTQKDLSSLYWTLQVELISRYNRRSSEPYDTDVETKKRQGR